MVPRVLTIAGSDSGGGAGIQADIKTITCLGGYAMSAITALTAQNTNGVFGIQSVPTDFIAQQITLCLEDIGADAIKTGMLHSAEVIEAVADALYIPHRPSRPVMDSDVIRSRAQHMRKNPTPAEASLWQQLRNKQLGTKFRRQHPIDAYIVDFVALKEKLIIELDGGQHTEKKAKQYDNQRTKHLESLGFTVARFWNNDILCNMDGVLQTIHDTLLSTPFPNPSPQGKGSVTSLNMGEDRWGTIHQIPLVVDTVMVAKGGAPLLTPSAMDALKALLIPRAQLITPNLPEAELLLGRTISAGDMQQAATDLLAMGSHAVLLKGGHMEGDTLTDVLATKENTELFQSPRIATNHTHGTGCTLAAAIATGLAKQQSINTAVAQARDYVQAAIKAAPGLGNGHGPLGHNVSISLGHRHAD